MSFLLNQLAQEVVGVNISKGWYEQERTFGDEMALLMSEVSEAFDTWRKIGFARLTQEDGKPDDVASELADVFIRLLDTCARHDIDLQQEYNRKMAYNKTHPYKHGGRAL